MITHLRTVQCQRLGRLVRITLSHRQAHNGIDRTMAQELLRVVTWCEGLSGLGAVLIEAEGRHFSVGGNLRDLSSQAERLAEALDDILVAYHDALNKLAELPVPVVCAVQGAVVGGALGLLGAADLVIAADDLTVRSAFASLGLSGDGGSTWHLPRLIGLRRAQQLFLTDRVLTAEEALKWGLVTQVVSRGRLASESLTAAETLAQGPTRALAASRRLLRQSGSNTHAQHLAAEREAMLDCARHEDAIARVRGFFEDRQRSVEQPNPGPP